MAEVKRDELGRIMKGQSGNPKGRPKNGTSFAEVMRRVIDKQIATKKDKDGNVNTIKGKEVVAEAIIQIAMDSRNNANVRLTAFNTALDRAYGKPLQEIEMETTATIQNDRAGEIKANLDKLSAEEREQYIELCEKVNEQEQ